MSVTLLLSDFSTPLQEFSSTRFLHNGWAGSPSGGDCRRPTPGARLSYHDPDDLNDRYTVSSTPEKPTRITQGVTMAKWLFKEEPSCYSFADLTRDGSTTWEGVSNALALKNLRSLKPGDQVFYYHTGKEKAIVGIMSVTALDLTDEKQPKVQVAPVKPLSQPVTLAQLKEEPLCAEWELIRISRLSVMPVPESIWKRVLEMAKGR